MLEIFHARPTGRRHGNSIKRASSREQSGTLTFEYEVSLSSRTMQLLPCTTALRQKSQSASQEFSRQFWNQMFIAGSNSMRVIHISKHPANLQF
jgi:hypothetical protein